MAGRQVTLGLGPAPVVQGVVGVVKPGAGGRPVGVTVSGPSWSGLDGSGSRVDRFFGRWRFAAGATQQRHRPHIRQVWLSGLPCVAGLHVHWWIAAPATADTAFTSTHLPLWRATSW